MNKPAVQHIAEFVCQHGMGRHPDMAVERAGLAWLDTLGCMLLGAESEVARIARRSAAGWGDGVAPVVGSDMQLPPPWAAMVNGTAAHALDLDDYTFIANDHPSAVLVPALLAAASGREHEISGMALLDAYLIGLEVIFCLGEAVNMGHYNLGWHTTSTLDSLGATAAVCRLWRLGVSRTAAALSLTTSMGSGYTSQFGTCGKPLHAGLSAKAGLLASSLGASGANAQLSALDGPVSFSSLLVPEGEARFEQSVKRLGNPWGIEVHGLGAKVYPSCGYVHRVVDAAIIARKDLDLTDTGLVESVTASLPDFHLAVLPYGLPRDPTEALFSVPYCVAVALATGDNDIADFSPAAVQRPEILELAARVQVRERRSERAQLNFDPDDPDSIEVRLTDGRSVRSEVPIYTGAPGRDLDRERFVDKFIKCHQQYSRTAGRTKVSAERVIGAVGDLHSATDLGELAAALGPVHVESAG
jgi:2-methylcitrate dehydratase PrpD